MGKNFYYKFHSKDRIIKRGENFHLGSYGYPDPDSFSKIKEIFISGGLKKKYVEDDDDEDEDNRLYGPYTLNDINKAIEFATSKYTAKELLSLSYQGYTIDDDLLREIYQLSMLIFDADNYNESNSEKIEYISFGYY